MATSSGHTGGSGFRDILPSTSHRHRAGPESRQRSCVSLGRGIVPLAVDTIIAHAQRSAGGNVFAVPPMAVTLGMRNLLVAPKVRLYIDTGTWKRTILRILLFADPDVDYPVTLVSSHPDVHVVADRNSAVPPAPSSVIQP